MTDSIDPVLSREEWGRVVRDEVRVTLAFPAETAGLPDERIMVTNEWAPAVIALANHGLDEADPRKITSAWIELLRRVAKSARASADHRALQTLADALDSYLPPRS